MDTLNEILRALGHLEGRFDEFRDLSRRVSQLEIWQAWLKGAWATLAVAYVYLCRAAFGK